jgi:adenosylcobinamide kinase/adenosylcobinamide-phosphate guanylyltransferase
VKKSVLVLGGTRSGKSAFAQSLCEQIPGVHLYLATAPVRDDEMAERVRQHIEMRANKWDTVEEYTEIGDAILSRQGDYDVIMIDCLTLWLSNLMCTHDFSKAVLERYLSDLVSIINIFRDTIVFVSNEVGSGIVPDNRLARQFRDYSGIMNQTIGAACSEVYYVVAGFPIKLK